MDLCIIPSDQHTNKHMCIYTDSFKLSQYTPVQHEYQQPGRRWYP